jgi:c-di-GMP-binding flagellar brake protein YcgR
MQTRSADRRESTRYPVRVPLRIKEPRELRQLKTTIADVSNGGVSFALPKSLPEGAQLKVVLPIANQLFTMNGSVVRCAADDDPGPYRVGISFTEPSPTFHSQLEAQATQITALQKELSEMSGQEVPLEEAARQWVMLSAKQFSDLYTH